MDNRIRHLRNERNLTQEQLAALVDSHFTTINKLETGKMRLSDVWIEKISKALGVSPGSIFDDQPPGRKVQVLGHVGAGYEIYPIDDHAQGAGLDEVEAPPGAGPKTIAVIVRGDSMYPAYRENDLIFYDEINVDIVSLIGKECVVKLASGATYIKFLQQGSTPNTYTLNSYNAPPMVDQVIEWAALVRWVERRYD